MFYEDEDQDTEIVYEAPTQEQLQLTADHDSKLQPFLFALDESPRAPVRNLLRVSNQQHVHKVPAMEAPEDEAARRLSRTAREADIIAKSQAFGVPAEWIPGLDLV